jgi:hypothetical protein
VASSCPAHAVWLQLHLASTGATTISGTFAFSDVAEIERFAGAVWRKFLKGYEAANAPASIEELFDFADRAQQEIDTGRPAEFRQQDVALLVSTRRNLSRGVPADLDRLTPDARRDVEYRLLVAESVRRAESILLQRLEVPPTGGAA